MNEWYYLLLIATVIPVIYHFASIHIQKKKFIILFIIFSTLLFSYFQFSHFFIQAVIVLFLLFSTLYFQLLGSVVAILLICSLGIYFQNTFIPLSFYSITFLFSILFGITLQIYFKKMKTQKELQRRILTQSKELSVFHELSLAVQSTFNTEKLLHIYLSAVTAGYGLSFNRAMLFLKETNSNSLIGTYAIGPLTVKEGFQTYKNIVHTRKTTLQEVIYETEDPTNVDVNLNELTKNTSFVCNKNTIIDKAFETISPLLIDNSFPEDDVILILNKTFNMNHFAIIPLVSHGENIGVLFVDNLVNTREITMESLDTLSLVSTLMASTIKQSKQYEKTKTWAMKDGLTNLYNQRTFVLNAKKQIQHARLTNEPLSICIFDLDYFKIYNDTNGHLEGNELLIKLAHLLTKHVRQTDSIYRFGGEEFIILMPNTDQYTAYKLANKVRKIIANYPFNHREKQPEKKITVSIGVSTLLDKWNHYEQLLEAADMALYQSKNNGRNTVTIYGESL